MFKKSWILAYLIVSGVAHAERTSFQDYALKFEGGSLALDNFLPPDRLTYRDIAANARQMDYPSFLEYLFKAKPSFAFDYILLHGTGSLQKASLSSPRVVLFGDGLFISLETEPQINKRVEIIEFQKNTHKFSFHELIFGPTVQIVDNPKKCTSCHGDIPRPIWNPYDFWPNAFGSHLSRFGTSKEKLAYDQLEARTDGVFRYLQFPALSRNYNQIVETFTQYTHTLGMLSMTSELRENKSKVDPFIFTILGVLEGCIGLNADSEQQELLKEFMDPKYSQLIDSYLEGYQSSTTESRAGLKNYLQSYYQQRFQNSPLLFSMDHYRLEDEVAQISVLRFILDGIGIQLEDFILSQGQNPYFQTLPGNYRKDLSMAFLNYDNQSLLALNPSFASSSFGFQWPNYECNKIKRASLAATSQGPELTYSNNPQPEFKKRSDLGSCIHCHNITGQAPYIPFDDTMRLREWLKNDGLAKVTFRLNTDGPAQMPPADIMSQADRDQLQEIFQELSR